MWLVYSNLSLQIMFSKWYIQKIDKNPLILSSLGFFPSPKTSLQTSQTTAYASPSAVSTRTRLLAFQPLSPSTSQTQQLHALWIDNYVHRHEPILPQNRGVRGVRRVPIRTRGRGWEGVNRCRLLGGSDQLTSAIKVYYQLLFHSNLSTH